jgi:CHAT domain-containing protein/Tfp pilus assembly protein PilF
MDEASGCAQNMGMTHSHPSRCHRAGSRLLLAFLLSRAVSTPAVHAFTAPLDPPSGLEVVEVARGAATAAAGIEPGDVLLAWSRANEPEIPAFPRGGPLELPFDLSRVLLEAMPRDVVTLSGEHRGEPRTWVLPRGGSVFWGATETFPKLPEPLAARAREALAGMAAGQEGAEASLREVARLAAREKPERLASWLLAQGARLAAEGGTAELADSLYAEAVEPLERRGDPAAVLLLREWGRTWQRRSRWDEAETRYRRALAVAESAPSPSLGAPVSVQALAAAASLRGDRKLSAELYRQAAESFEQLAPGSAELASALNQIGSKATMRGDLDTAVQFLERALVVEEKLGIENGDWADIVSNLGTVEVMRSELVRADRFFERADAIQGRLGAVGTARTQLLANWGLVAMERGDLDRAESCFRTALELDTANNPDGLEVARDLTHLGNVALYRQDFETADLYVAKALEIFTRRSPEHPFAVGILSILADIAIARKDYKLARSYQERVLESDRKNAPDGIYPVEPLSALAEIELAQGDLEAARTTYEKALAVVAGDAPAGSHAGDILLGLGTIDVRRGRLAEAQATFERVLAIRERLAPDSADQAQALHELGALLLARGRGTEGTARLCAALDALDRQRRRVGGSHDAQTAFGVPFSSYYHDCAGALLAQGRTGEAFHTLERGRARSFLDLLAERDLRLAGGAPELEARQASLDGSYDEAQEELSGLSADRDGAAIDAVEARLGDLRRRREELAADFRKASPRLASLAYPQPLDAAATARALDPGTLLLSYSVGDTETYLFAVSAERPVGAFKLPVGEVELRRRVASFRRLVEDPRSDRSALELAAESLYRLLIGPADRRVRRSGRLLVSTDGPLATLPFAALRRRGRYLAESKPLATVLSATVFAELKADRRSPPATEAPRLAAFGDPVYPAAPKAPEKQEDGAPRSAILRGLPLAPLPGSRREVEAIAALYPNAASYLGADATEEQVKSVGPEVRVLHLATHGLLDERRPLDSALALSLPRNPRPGEDNGLLQVWEIFEKLELHADLVTLSACGTALGQEVSGEGLIGLTRAFQYAGARSVLASLWSVADDSTADLMQRFYRSLRRGESKDEALQQAQAGLLRRRGTAHPY